MADRTESAADVVVSLGDETDIVVERLTVSKDIDIEQIYGSNRTLPDSYAINQVSYQGTVELQGNRLDLEEQMYDRNGIPEEFEITITHLNGEATVYGQCLVTSEGWEMSSGESTTTTFEFVAHAKSHGGEVDTEPNA
jgi:hypothetical protein